MDGKQAVRRLVEMINTRQLDEVDQLVTDGLAPKLRRAFEDTWTQARQLAGTEVSVGELGSPS